MWEKWWSHGLTVRGSETNASSGRYGATSSFSQIGEFSYIGNNFKHLFEVGIYYLDIYHTLEVFNKIIWFWC